MRLQRVSIAGHGAVGQTVQHAKATGLHHHVCRPLPCVSQCERLSACSPEGAIHGSNRRISHGKKAASIPPQDSAQRALRLLIELLCEVPVIPQYDMAR